MERDLHNKSFDEGTKAKLAIFRDYLREWLPVFIKKKRDLLENNQHIRFFCWSR